MLKILLATNTYQQLTHGPSRRAQLMRRAVLENMPQVDLRILTEDSPARPESGIYSLRVSYPTSLEPASKLLRMWRYAKEVERVYERWAFDAVVFLDGVQGLAAALSKRRYRVLVSVNDDDNLLTARRPYETTKRHWWRSSFHQLEKAAARKADGMLVPSVYLQQLALQRYSPQASVEVVVPGIDAEEFAQLRNSPPPNVHRILFIKSDPLRGGLMALVDALGEMHSAGIALPEVVLAGFEDQGIINAVRERLSAPVIFSGYLTRSEVFEQLALATIGVVPSYFEGFGITSLEYQLAGLTTVVAATGGLPETLLQGADVHTFSHGGTPSLTVLLKACLVLPPQRSVPAGYQHDYVSMTRAFVAAVGGESGLSTA